MSTSDASGTTAATAVAFSSPGGPEVLSVIELPVAEPGPGEARIRVTAAAVHPADLVVRAGIRPIEVGPPFVPGMAVAGTVSAVGAGSRWSVGDRVMTMTLPSSPYGGGYRASVVAPDDTISGVPDDLSLEIAATLPMNGHTALQIVDALEVGPGTTLAVTGAAGALGSLLVPLAKARGAHVIAAARPHDAARLAALDPGAVVASDDLVAGILVAAGGPVDAIADLAVLDEGVLPAVRPGGRIATLRGWQGPADGQVHVHAVAVPREWHRGARLEEVSRITARDRPVEVFAPAEAAQTHRLVQDGGLRRSLVISFA